MENKISNLEGKVEKDKIREKYKRKFKKLLVPTLTTGILSTAIIISGVTYRNQKASQNNKDYGNLIKKYNVIQSTLEDLNQEKAKYPSFKIEYDKDEFKKILDEGFLEDIEKTKCLDKAIKKAEQDLQVLKENNNFQEYKIKKHVIDKYLFYPLIFGGMSALVSATILYGGLIHLNEERDEELEKSK